MPPHYRQALRSLQEFVDKSGTDSDFSRSFYLINTKLAKFDDYAVFFPDGKTKA